MKRYGNLWSPIVSWENLLLAARKAQRGKRDRSYVHRFNYDSERKLLRLAGELNDGSYQPGGFRTHWISRPKPRMISAAPYRDRVVHHALMNVLEPILDRHFHPDSYACRRGKGTHAAADRLQSLMRRKDYFLQCDIRKFFPSIDHEVLKGRFRRLIKDKRVLYLIDLIVDSSNQQEHVSEWFPGDRLFTPFERKRGLPIGNLTSQWFANWYLDGLDHYVTSYLRLGSYVRYCDDFIVLDNDRQRLKAAVQDIGRFLAGYRLKLHENKLHIRSVCHGAGFVGYRIWPAYRKVRKKNVRSFRLRVAHMKQCYKEGKMDSEEIKCRLMSWMAHARQADSEELIRRLSREWVFQEGPCRA